jgi:uncharacterized protein (TIGR02145 family)
MLKFCVWVTLPALLFLGCGGYEDKEVFENGRYNNKCHGYQYDRSSQYCDNGVIKDKEEFTDVRDGKTYKHKYVKIGEQMWMAENLKYEAPNTKCYDDDPGNCEIFGRMYDWETAKTICPNGWHLPDDNEFNALANFVETVSGCVNCAGIMLKANSTLWISNKGDDEFGFTALPGGFYRGDDSGFSQKNWNAGFWSATEGYMSGSAHFRYFTSNNASRNNTLNLDGFYIERAFANVRCVGD